MRFRIADRTLARIDADPDFNGGYSVALVRAFRRRMALIRAARDETDFYALKSLHFEKLSGKRAHERSMRLNDQFRLILEVVKEKGQPDNLVVVVGIEDYH
jgi:toxin HigB-1